MGWELPASWTRLAEAVALSNRAGWLRVVAGTLWSWKPLNVGVDVRGLRVGLRNQAHQRPRQGGRAVSPDEQRELWRRRAGWLAQLGLAEGDAPPVEIIEEVANAVLVLVDEVEQLARQRDEARAWARGYEHGMFVGVDTDAPPAWLTAPLELNDE